MFSLKVVDTDAFLDMPISSQLLYFQLAMRADDDGFVANTKKIMRMLGSQDDDLKVLVVKKFVIPFESGVCVIKHWLIHNLIRGDRYIETQWIKEKKQLKIDEKTNKYQLIHNVIPNGNQVLPQDRLELDKERIEQDRKEKVKNISETSSENIPASKEVSEIIHSFEGINPAVKRMYGNTTQRKACQDLIDSYTFEKVKTTIENVLPKIKGMKYFPTITTPLQLCEKWSSLESAIARYQQDSNKLKWI
jgi:hypothetical protein